MDNAPADQDPPSNREPRSDWTPRLIAVVAATPNHVIGLDGGMPWQLRSDLQRFKRGTMGGVLLMGRKTFDSIGRPLPGRTTVVVTRQPDWKHEGVVVAHGNDALEGDSTGSIDEAVNRGLQLASLSGSHVYVVGGAEIYRQVLNRCDEIWRTDVWSAISGDTHLKLDLSNWRCVELIRQPAGPRDSVPTQWNRLVRR